MTSYRLGLDVGTNSLGWSVLELSEQGGNMLPCRVVNAGVRIFSDGRDVKSKATLKADRRMARSARRRRDRFKQRQTFLISELQKAGLFPSDEDGMKQLQALNPLELRAAALTEKLPAYHVGRALFHLNQRRGFKSNRKDRSEEVTSGKVSTSVRLLLEQMGLINPPISKEEYKELSKEDKKKARQKEAEDRDLALKKLSCDRTLTYGAFLWKRHQEGRPTRARPGVGGSGKLYDVYPQRELYDDEFNKIWDSQAPYHSKLMNDNARKHIHTAIFSQRTLEAQTRGKCAYLPAEDRTFRAMPSFQRYRMLQDLNHLEWTVGGRVYRLRDYQDARDAILGMMEIVSTRTRQFVWSKMKNILKRMELAEGNFTFNFETPKRRGLDVNLTSKIMQQEEYVGADWHSWSVEKQDKFIAVILDDEQDDDEVRQCLIQEFDLPEQKARKCVYALLVEGTANISLKAARLINQKMSDEMMNQFDAVKAVAEEYNDFINPSTRAREGKLLPHLLYYGEWFYERGHIIPGDRNPDDRNDDLKFFGGVTNPTVHIALNQIRQVVNELIDRYGHPYSVAVELGRDLPAGQEQRREIENDQKKNQQENERLDGILRENGQIPNRDNRLRLFLWEELDKEDPVGRRCPFSGDIIGITDLFNGRAEIEHLIPFSVSLDDSRANKVLCTRQANRDKGNRTPFDAFGNSPDGYTWEDIAARAQRLPKPKQWRFQEDALKIWYRDCTDFSERHLNDTRYIGRLTKEYLESICPFNKIDVVTGRLTALLRGHWGLNGIYRNHNATGDGPKSKTRDDHRHHAVDAVVVGMTTRSMLQKVATAAGRAEELDLDRLFEKKNNGRSPIEPWSSFRDEVAEVAQNITVSHKKRRKKLVFRTNDGKLRRTTDGQLHNDTAYRIVSGPNEKGRCEVVARKPIAKFETRKHLSEIRDRYLRDEFLKVFDANGIEAFINLAEKKGIRSLRYTKNSTVIPVEDESGNVYKAYEGDSNWGIEIYQYPNTHKKADKWEGVVISRFEANQPGFEPGHSCKPHPAARLVMRLQRDDCIEIEQDDQKQIMRLQKISHVLTFAPLYEANVDARHRDKADPFKYTERGVGTLKSLNARKVHISPTGRINHEKRRKPAHH